MSPSSEEPRTATPCSRANIRQKNENCFCGSLIAQLSRRWKGASIDANPPTAHLSEPRGAFITLHLDGHLRGCIGYVMPTQSLYATVAEAARAAAFEDPRFPR